jgi:DNA-binding PadR family transcriptional regulator
MQLRDVLLVLLRDPASGWDLATRLEQQLPRLMAARPSQIYPVLHRLEAAGLVASQDEPSRKGPPRRVHELTEAGRERVAAILARPPATGPGRRPDLIQLALLDGLADASAADAVLATLLARWRADLAACRHDLLAVESAPAPAPDDPQSLKRLGLTLMEAELDARVSVLAAFLDTRSAPPGPL